MTDYISLLGLIYVVGKDAISAYLKSGKNKSENKESKNEDKYSEIVRTVNANYLDESGLKDAWEKQGYKLYWARPENIASYELKGYKIMYGIDMQKKEIFSLELPRDKLVLMGKKNGEVTKENSTEHIKPKDAT